MESRQSKNPVRRMALLAVCVPLFALTLVPLSQAATPTTRAVHAFLQGADIDDELESRSAPDRNLRVNVWHDREDDDTYRRGEAINVHFRTNADMYVVVYRLDTDGRVEVLWPTTRYDDGFVYGNHAYTLPRPGSPIRLTASQLRGVEYVEAIASEYPFDLRNLAIDFRFDPDSRGDYEYEVSGDPFLAVNDINYAITGLESDVDYIVTDWAHLYVESKVEYARYTCRQCHGEDDQDYHPYVDHCSTVNIYNDWGWQTSWYNRFGWYPLYYEPPYYYWDIAYARPYWYPYYPLVYSWPSYGVYVRPYPVYWWYDSPYTYVDYRVRYKKNWRHYRPLYDLDGTRVRVARRDLDSDRGANRSPASMRGRLRDGTRGGRVTEDRLVRDRMPDRSHRGDVGPTVTTRRSGPRIADGKNPGRTGVRTDLSRRSESRRLRSLPSARSSSREGLRAERGERRWTKPVLRNREDGSRRSRSEAKRDRPPERRSRSEAKRDRPPERRSRSEAKRDRPPERRSRSEAKRDRPPERRSRSEAKRDRNPERQRTEARQDRRSRSNSRRDVKPPSRRSQSEPRQKVAPSERRGGKRSEGRNVSPSRSKGSSSKSSPSRSSRGGGSRSRDRGNRGGRG